MTDLKRIARLLDGRVVLDSVAFAPPGSTLRTCSLRPSVIAPSGYILFPGVGCDRRQLEAYVAERLKFGRLAHG